jgi:hypothetical protein
MQKTRVTALIAGAALFTLVAACSSYIPYVDYSQPFESALAPDAHNYVHDERYGIVFSVEPLLRRENMDTTDEIILIRNRSGYYFVTASGFNHVYVLEPGPGELKIDNDIELTTEGIQRPGFNQRGDHIEVVDRATGESFQVNENGRL